MITEVFISYSWWTVLLVVAVGLLYAGLLYVKNPLNKLTTSLSVFLFILRFITVFTLGFLLLSPTIKSKIKQIEKPIVIIGQDNSRSILMTKDSLFYSDTMSQNMELLINQLSHNNYVESLLFGENITEGDKPNYRDNSSNYSDFFTYIKQNYTGLNVGAIILTGDGIVNNGIDAVYAASDIDYPIFTIALGDTLQARDARIDDVRYNSIAYSGDRFPIEVSISANKMKDVNTSVKLLENNKIVSVKPIRFSHEDYRESITFDVEAKNAGKRRYSIIIEPAIDEISIENNIKNIFVDIIDSRQKILILAFAPHPDVGAIKQSLVRNKNYEITVEYISSFTKDIKKFDLIILHQIPSKRNSGIRLLRKIQEEKIPVLYVLGNQSNLGVFNQFYKGLNIISAVGNNVPAQFEFNNSFTYFSFNEELATQLATLPPLSVPLGNYSLTVGAEAFGLDVINNVVTDYPMVVYHNNMGVKSGVICGEGIWLWRIHNYLQNNNSDAVDAFINKAAMFLIADTDKRHFKILSHGEYSINRDIVLGAELYNQALELVNTTDVALTLTNEIGEKFDFGFAPFNDYYKLNLNQLPVGIYSYKATAKLGIDKYYDTGEFIVKQLDNESRNLNANHRIMNQLALEHEGKMYYPKNIGSLTSHIENLESMTSKIHYQDKFTGLNSIIYVLFGIIFLLVVEWFLRKYFGNY